MIRELLGMLKGNSGNDLPHPIPGVMDAPQLDSSAFLSALSGSPGMALPPMPTKKKEPSNVGKLVIEHFARQKFRPNNNINQANQQIPPVQPGQGTPPRY